eukprot:5823823-Prymnesium_polylepis.2
MQTMQRIQQMQQQMQQMQADDAAKPSGPLALPGGAQAASLAVAEQAWAQQLQQRTPGGHLLSAATIADASPLAAPPSAPSAPPSTLPANATRLAVRRARGHAGDALASDGRERRPAQGDVEATGGRAAEGARGKGRPQVGAGSCGCGWTVQRRGEPW